MNVEILSANERNKNMDLRNLSSQILFMTRTMTSPVQMTMNKALEQINPTLNPEQINKLGKMAEMSKMNFINSEKEQFQKIKEFIKNKDEKSIKKILDQNILKYFEILTLVGRLKQERKELYEISSKCVAPSDSEDSQSIQRLHGLDISLDRATKRMQALKEQVDVFSDFFTSSDVSVREDQRSKASNKAIDYCNHKIKMLEDGKIPDAYLKHKYKQIRMFESVLGIPAPWERMMKTVEKCVFNTTNEMEFPNTSYLLLHLLRSDLPISLNFAQRTGAFHNSASATHDLYVFLGAKSLVDLVDDSLNAWRASNVKKHYNDYLKKCKKLMKNNEFDEYMMEKSQCHQYIEITPSANKTSSKENLLQIHIKWPELESRLLELIDKKEKEMLIDVEKTELDFIEKINLSKQISDTHRKIRNRRVSKILTNRGPGFIAAATTGVPGFAYLSATSALSSIIEGRRMGDQHLKNLAERSVSKKYDYHQYEIAKLFLDIQKKEQFKNVVKGLIEGKQPTLTQWCEDEKINESIHKVLDRVYNETRLIPYDPSQSEIIRMSKERIVKGKLMDYLRLAANQYGLDEVHAKGSLMEQKGLVDPHKAWKVKKELTTQLPADYATTLLFNFFDSLGISKMEALEHVTAKNDIARGKKNIDIIKQDPDYQFETKIAEKITFSRDELLMLYLQFNDYYTLAKDMNTVNPEKELRRFVREALAEKIDDYLQKEMGEIGEFNTYSKEKLSHAAMRIDINPGKIVRSGRRFKDTSEIFRAGLLKKR